MRTSWIIPIILLIATPALAQFRIKAPSPGKADFREAIRQSRSVDRQVPMRLQASTRPQSITTVRDGVVHERATVIANVPFESFMRRMDPANWSKNLPQR